MSFIAFIQKAVFDLVILAFIIYGVYLGLKKKKGIIKELKNIKHIIKKEDNQMARYTNQEIEEQKLKVEEASENKEEQKIVYFPKAVTKEELLNIINDKLDFIVSKLK